MTAIEIFTLVLVILFVAAGVGYNYSKHHGSLKDMVEDVKDIEVQVQQVEDELYNKDLRPIVAKKSTTKSTEETKSEFPIEKPKKKRKYYPKKPKTSI